MRFEARLAAAAGRFVVGAFFFFFFGGCALASAAGAGRSTFGGAGACASSAGGTGVATDGSVVGEGFAGTWSWRFDFEAAGLRAFFDSVASRDNTDSRSS